MESQRSFLIIGLLLVSYLLWIEWQKDYDPQPTDVVTQTLTEQQSSVPDSVPNSTLQRENSADVPIDESTLAQRQPQANQAQLITVTTDTLKVLVDSKGGDIVSVELLKFPVKQGASEPYHILKPATNQLYVAQSGLIGANGPDGSANGRPLYAASQQEYQLQSGENQLVVPLTYRSPEGLQVNKNIVFTAGSHQIKFDYKLTNTSSAGMQVQAYAQLKQTTSQPEGSMFMPTYRGAAYSTKEERYEKYYFDDISDENLRQTTEGGWVGMLEHYFVSAWVPPQNQVNNLYTRNLQDRYALIGFTGQSENIAAGQSIEINNSLYVGPKDQETLAEIARGLDLTVDYGILWWISQPLFALLKFIHSIVGNWGFSIVIITVLVKGVMYPLTKAQYESMAKMRALQPKMQALKDRHGDDRQKMSQGMMELYKKEKVNPMGGCFPLLLQMPIFLALYWVLLESVELRHADFVLWITDLSVKDPFFVLPILTGLSMYLLQKLQPMTMTDPMQQKIMQWMPVAMSLFFFIFPAGLVLYWLVSNIITLIQAKIIYSSMEKRGLKTR